MVSAWDFNPADIQVPVQMWQGEKDMDAPPHGALYKQHSPTQQDHLLSRRRSFVADGQPYRRDPYGSGFLTSK